jgi:GT2 family glycosyltransferase
MNKYKKFIRDNLFLFLLFFFLKVFLFPFIYFIKKCIFSELSTYENKIKIQNFGYKYFKLLIHVMSENFIKDQFRVEKFNSKPLLSQNEVESLLKKKFNVNSLKLRIERNPTVSIVIPCYGKLNYTLALLLSISKYPPNTPFEVIIVDDLPDDNSYNLIKKIKSIKYIKNKKNLGYIKSINAGAKFAKGKFIYTLNNDTQVTPGWLDNLVNTFKNFPGTGLVGSKLLYPDGSLQEAGGILWRDGSAWNFGNGQNPDSPEFNYVREVDYCTGASNLMPKKLFDSLGGLDEIYVPAYCDDSDIALKIRHKGYRVIYQPNSVLYHFEGITQGTDTSEGIKAYQVSNTLKLFKRWKRVLINYEESGTNLNKAKDRGHSFRVLYLDATTPTADQDAGSLTAFNLMILLKNLGGQVTFIPENLAYIEGYSASLQENGIEIFYRPYLQSLDDHLKKEGSRYDLVISARPMHSHVIFNNIKKYCKKAKIIYNSVDIHFLRLLRQLEFDKTVRKKDIAIIKSIELSLLRRSDKSLILSKYEFEILSKTISKDKLYLLPLMLSPLEKISSFFKRKDILFIGGFRHPPNADAVNYFVKEVMPILRKSLPGVNFLIIGSNPTEKVLRLADSDIKVLGYVPDISEIFNKVRLSVAPIRYGAGIKGKIGTSLAYGVPVVATSVAAEGMGLENKKNILIADNPLDFANAIVNLYKSNYLWKKLSNESLFFVRKNWSEEVIKKMLKLILNSLKIKTKKVTQPFKFYT